MQLSLASEIRIKPSHSASFTRLLVIIYVLTLALIMHTESYLWLQVGLALLASYLFWPAYRCKNPCPELVELRVVQQRWFISLKNGKLVQYEKAAILIHNPLFQLIQFVDANQNKRIVLFNDQISPDQLRLLHIKAE